MVRRLRAVAVLLALTATASADAQQAKPVVELLGDRGAIDASKLDALVGLELGADAARVSGVTIAVREGHADVDVRLGAERRKGSVAIAAVRRGADPRPLRRRAGAGQRNGGGGKRAGRDP